MFLANVNVVRALQENKITTCSTLELNKTLISLHIIIFFFFIILFYIVQKGKKKVYPKKEYSLQSLR